MKTNALAAKKRRKFWPSKVMETLKNDSVQAVFCDFLQSCRKFKALIINMLSVYIFNKTNAFAVFQPFANGAVFLTEAKKSVNICKAIIQKTPAAKRIEPSTKRHRL